MEEGDAGAESTVRQISNSQAMLVEIGQLSAQ
jgi:hypothetical protein